MMVKMILVKDDGTEQYGGIKSHEKCLENMRYYYDNFRDDDDLPMYMDVINKIEHLNKCYKLEVSKEKERKD